MSSALAETDTPAPPVHAFELVLRERIAPSPLNPRKHFDQTKLEELAGTMGNGVGIIEPLVVRPIAESAHDRIADFEIVAGERRWRAAGIAGLTDLPIVVRYLTDAQVLEIMVIENDQREGVNPLEEADGFKRLMTFGFDIDKLAGRISRSRKYIYDRVKLLELIPAVQQLLLAGRITTGHAILIARLTPEQQARIIDPDALGYRSPLFEDEHTLLTDSELDAVDAARAQDPYVGMKTRSVRELQAWIDEHCRFDPRAEVNQELYPTTATTVEDAEKVISITRSFRIDPDAKDGDSKRIFTERAWKRADGLESSKTCARSVTGVVVVGPGRGDAFKVCVHKECDVHWKAERAAREKAAAGGSANDSWKKRQEAADRKRAAEEEKAQAARALYLKARPQMIAAIAEQMKTAGLPPLVDVITRALRANIAPAVKRLGKPATADQVLRVFALAVVISTAENDYYGPTYMPAVLKGFGLKYDALLKQAAQASAPASAEKAKTATSRRKKAR